MPFFPSLPADAGPPHVYTSYPEVYRPWSEMSDALMNGESPLSKGEREMILAFAAGVAGCPGVQVAHSEVAYTLGVRAGLVEKLVEDVATAPVDERSRALLVFVRKLAADPADMTQADADTVLDAGWSERALHDAIAITARAAFMQRLIQGHGFTPLSRAEAAKRASRRVEQGYVNLYPSFRAGSNGAAAAGE
jgi:uncharacterized peroxidase-related enzyme